MERTSGGVLQWDYCIKKDSNVETECYNHRLLERRDGVRGTIRTEETVPDSLTDGATYLLLIWEDGQPCTTTYRHINTAFQRTSQAAKHGDALSQLNWINYFHMVSHKDLGQKRETHQRITWGWSQGLSWLMSCFPQGAKQFKLLNTSTTFKSYLRTYGFF